MVEVRFTMLFALLFLLPACTIQSPNLHDNITDQRAAKCTQHDTAPRVSGRLQQEVKQEGGSATLPAEDTAIRVFPGEFLNTINTSTVEWFKDARVRGPFWGLAAIRSDLKKQVLERTMTDENGCFSARLSSGDNWLCFGERILQCFKITGSTVALNVTGQPSEKLRADNPWMVENNTIATTAKTIEVFPNATAIPREEERQQKEEEDTAKSNDTTEEDKNSQFTKLLVALNVTESEHTGRMNILFTENAERGWDGYEASRLAPPRRSKYVQLVSPIEKDGSLQLRVQAGEPLPYDTAVTVPIGVYAKNLSGTAEMRVIDKKNSIPKEWNVELIDTENDKRTGLNEAIQFELEPGEVTSVDTRFLVRIFKQ